MCICAPAPAGNKAPSRMTGPQHALLHVSCAFTIAHTCAADPAGNKAPSQMTEEEWLKRQEGLERRRMRSLRDKREAEETIKAKLRKAVTARFRGKLGAGAGGGEGSGTEGEAAGGTRGTGSQVSINGGGGGAF
jgi:hypothetical protein